MFQAVRKWWRSGRGQRTVRLFAFELTVVMIGVLTAQQISNWAQRRSALRQVETVHGDLFHSFGIYRTIAQTDRIAIPCIEQRIDTILQLAGDREAIDPQLLSSVSLTEMGPDEIAPADEQLLRERYGHTTTDEMTSIEFNLRIASDAFRDLNRQWLEFQRADPRHGKVTDPDLAAVRAAAIQMKGDLSLLNKSLVSIDRLAASLGIAVLPDPTFRPITSCDEMWRIGRGYVGF